MVGTIGSVGYGADQEARRVWRKLFLLYILGSVAGGILLGGTVGTGAAAIGALEEFGGVPRVYVNSVGIVLLAAMMLHDLGVVGFRLPSRDRQVPMAWKRLPGYWSPFVYGLSLGTGVSTAIYLGSFYAVLIVTVLLRDLLLGVVIGILYAVGRSLLILVSVHSPGGPDELSARLAPLTGIVAKVNGVITLLAIGVLAVGLGRSVP